MHACTRTRWIQQTCFCIFIQNESSRRASLLSCCLWSHRYPAALSIQLLWSSALIYPFYCRQINDIAVSFAYFFIFAIWWLILCAIVFLSWLITSLHAQYSLQNSIAVIKKSYFMATFDKINLNSVKCQKWLCVFGNIFTVSYSCRILAKNFGLSAPWDAADQFINLKSQGKTSVGSQLDFFHQISSYTIMQGGEKKFTCEISSLWHFPLIKTFIT